MKSKSSNIFFPKKIGKSLAFLAAALVLIIAAWSLFKMPVQQPPSTTATLILDLGKESRTFEGEALESMTILDTLIASANAGKIDFDYTFSEEGVKITLLNGHSASNSPIDFSFSINSNEVPASQIDKMTVEPGDTIKIGVKTYENK